LFVFCNLSLHINCTIRWKLHNLRRDKDTIHRWTFWFSGWLEKILHLNMLGKYADCFHALANFPLSCLTISRTCKLELKKTEKVSKTC
jgi:hypothetical protein